MESSVLSSCINLRAPLSVHAILWPIKSWFYEYFGHRELTMGLGTKITPAQDPKERFGVKTGLKRRFRGVALTSQSMGSPSIF